ncbi:hypothetical protein [Aerolutibacter daejeonensis]|uniref:hypothetical protein n=1 Tax=Aerolutibacter daejeonensis TaxID=346181 RepID=UPI0018DDD9F9|nr:hypothetical protein [Lysobacter daejeonensis]
MSPPVSAEVTQGTTFYVRTDGGNADQCDGRANTGYPGRGQRLTCAWSSPEVALPRSGSARISPGDTLRIAAGVYKIGREMQAIPSGPSRAVPTRILGQSGQAPKLVGTNGIHRVVNLDGSSNVEVAHLEITDDSDCVYRHAVAAARCSDGMPWARVGLYARASAHVWLHDLNIHGMAARGVNAGGLENWTVERVRIIGNGTSGWDGNVGERGSNRGRIVLRHLEIAWNGCGERVQTGKPWACWAQQTGGYGDGLGTTDTGGQWLIEDVDVHHNTSDGLDLRYMDGADGTNVVLRRIRAVANAGNQVKVRGNALLEDSILVGHCTYFRGKFNMTEGDLCRSDGSTLQLVLTGGDRVLVRNNTLAGEGGAQIGHSEGQGGTDDVRIQGNVVIGFPHYLRPEQMSAFSAGKSSAVIRYADNMGWTVAGCPRGTKCDANPKLRDMSLASFDARPLPGSPALGKAGAIPCMK